MNVPGELRCAIYTRKSSEEGLEQSFNSLDAQREGCEAFILSQRQEGWRPVGNRYDDGGFSGGTIQRPALQKLLEDVRNGKIDVIVVYKVDRLTRSLADFAKIVEILDASRVSFVSVTQQFNTTTSMGRLTLNVLLSFAQFEREVTGERIRDKIAASKKKGMWMGGAVPLGYDLQGRKLVPNRREAAIVCKIFTLYLELGCVSKLTAQLSREKVKSKAYVTQGRMRRGGLPFSRGALYHLLRNHLYIGEIRHRDNWYPGEHLGIVPIEVWKDVQARLTENASVRRQYLQDRSSSLLTGVLEDGRGNRYTPSFTKKNGRRYRYYVSQESIKNPGHAPSPIRRLPAGEIEAVVCERLRSLLTCEVDLFDILGSEIESPGLMRQLIASAKGIAQHSDRSAADKLRPFVLALVRQVVVNEAAVQIFVSKLGLRQLLESRGKISGLSIVDDVRRRDDLVKLDVEAKRKRCGGEVHLTLAPNTSPANVDVKASLVKAVVRAHSWYQRVLRNEALDQRELARQAGLTERYVGRVFACAFLAPDIVVAILDGHQPRDLTFEKLTRNTPLSWTEQRENFGF